MMTISNYVGRLWEVRWTAPFTDSEAEEFILAKSAVVEHAIGPLVICSDLRHAAVLPVATVDRLIAVLQSDSSRVERHALLLGDGAIVGLQVTRMVRESGGDARQVFHDALKVVTWLAPVLIPREQQRLKAFLAHGHA